VTPGSEPAADGSAAPWAGRTHAELAELARELLMAGHMIDRSGMPHLIERYGREGMTEIAINEWMAASPIYSKRTQRLLGFEGDTVETIFKGMQVDVGAPPEFLDFRYTVHDDHHGEFHLDHCGALMDVEPMGAEYVHAMCHTIEDPTFDATATASNPRAQVRPVHRPPRTPADRHPHCAWTVTIVPEADPLPHPAQAEHLATTNAARLPLAPAYPELADDDGWNDYAVPLDPDLVMERFSSATLARILDEVALQGHLLSHAYMIEVADRSGGDVAVELGVKQVVGVAGLTAKRLAAALGVGADLDGVAAVLAVHPLVLPRAYVTTALARTDRGLRFSLSTCPATEEADGFSWPALLATPAGTRVVTSVVRCVAPATTVEAARPAPGELAAWEIGLDPDAGPADLPGEVALTEFSTGARFGFTRRGDREVEVALRH
jgi:hypothetical protein